MFGNDSTIFRIPAPFGFTVEVRQSILFLIGLIVVFNFNPSTMHYTMIYAAALFLSIYLHEIGHAWGCKIQNIRVREIVLYGGGGYCLPGRSMNRKEDELVTAMGPIVTISLWAICSLAVPYTSGMGLLSYFISTMAWLNGFLAIFNLLPVMPLDGGRLFRLILARLMKPLTASRIAGGVGLFFCGLWALYMVGIVTGITGGFFLLFIPNFRLHLNMIRHGHF
ncbi:MAG: site-2 protease family protein [Maritimibacter sp.]